MKRAVRIALLPGPRLLPGLRRLPALMLLPVVLTAGCAPEMERNAAEGRDAATTEILWDLYGIPHIHAASDEELFHAFGWAQARSHGDVILRLYGTARGRAAEYWGEEHLESDRRIRTVGIPERGRSWYEAQHPRFRGFLDAFADGMNDYAARHPERIADDARAVLPVSGADVLAHVQRVVHWTFMTWRQDGVTQRWREEGRAAAPARAAPPHAARALDAAARGAAGTVGSNAWAVGPARSASGNALLLANPHLPWEGLFLVYEARLVSPSLDLYGATLVGVPFLGFAFNERLGWTHTVNPLDGADLYELTLVEGGYLWDGGVRPLETSRETLKVRGPDGSLEERPLEIHRSVHGPVVAAREGRALAIRVAGLEEPHVFEQYWEMGRARSLEEFETALARLQMPIFTVMYADADGRILHLFGGRVPIRPPGPWNWAGIVPGDTSATLWTETHPYEDLPRVVDPPSGWLQNANDPPWTTTFPRALDADDYPPYMAPRGMAFRPQRSARMLVEDESIDLEGMIRYKHSTRMELADRLVDEVVEAARTHGNGEARRAAEILDRWDRSADRESRGAVLFQAFWGELFARSGGYRGIFARRWDPGEPLDTPAGLADPEEAARALAAAAGRVEAAHGRLDVAWGEVNRLRLDGLDLPGNGGPDELGVFRTVHFAPDEDGRARAVSGDTWTAAIEFSTPPRARALTVYGNASQPGSPHRTDQLEAFSRQELRPVWLDREEVERNLAEREVPVRERPRSRAVNR